MKDKLLTKCSFSNAWETREGDRYPKSELGYIRAYIKDGRWWNTFFPVHWELNTPELVEEFKQVYAEFKKDFPTLGSVIRYVEHEAETMDNDPDEGNAYLELQHGLYWLRMITRKGDYNLYLTCLSRAACEQQKTDDGKDGA